MGEYIDEDAIEENLPVQTRPAFFHGTKVEPFDTPAPDTCVNNDVRMAITLANTGSYYSEESQTGNPRVILIEVNMPEGEPIIPVSRGTQRLMTALTEGICRDEDYLEAVTKLLQSMKFLHENYHEEAMKLGRERKLAGYYADLFRKGSTKTLVIVDPGTARIMNQHVETTVLKEISRTQPDCDYG